MRSWLPETRVREIDARRVVLAALIAFPITVGLLILFLVVTPK